MGSRKWTILLTLVALVAGGLMAYQGVVPESFTLFGYAFAIVRVAAYLMLFVFYFDQLTIPLLTRVSGDPDYARIHVRPYRFRCFFWALLLEFFLVWFTL